VGLPVVSGHVDIGRDPSGPMGPVANNAVGSNELHGIAAAARFASFTHLGGCIAVRTGGNVYQAIGFGRHDGIPAFLTSE
jgi:hypothetical protein